MIGQTISHYSILEKLGEGGMGVVYKAQDTKLNRSVALKFLPAHLSATEEDKARFMQEAQAAAALNHPNICTIYGIEESGGQMFIAMEFVEGQTLHDRRLNLPLKQAIEIGIQLADGLAAAHEKGIVHRDIKSENIMLQKDGRVRIMDFGLARIKSASRLTKVGSTVGTTGYMSPEQVQGMQSDHRSDIFSLGVILYELFAGQSPFKGAHETAINYEIVNVDPEPISSIKPEFDPELDAVVMDCLAKDPADRSQSAAEVAKDLRHAKRESSRSRLSRVSTVRPITSPAGSGEALDPLLDISPKKTRVPWIVAGVSLFGFLMIGFLYFGNPSSERTPIVAVIPAPDTYIYHSYGFAAGPAVVSPNGKMIAFTALSQEGKAMIFLRPLDVTAAKPLWGTEQGYYPFWSPDSRWLGFFSLGTGKLKKIDIAGGPPVTICDAQFGRGGTWNNDETILFTPNANSGLLQVSAAGGVPTELTRLDSSRNESSHRWPVFLPDGKHFLYYSRTASFGAEAEGDALFVASLDLKVHKPLLNSSANALVAGGQLLFMRGTSLMAQSFHSGSLELEGNATTLATGIINDPGFNLAVFSASQNGLLAYQTGEGLAGARMAILDRTGRELGFVGDIIEHFTPRPSPDGHRLVAFIFEPKSRTSNLWIYDLQRGGGRTRLTSGLAIDTNPVWSPDGSKIAFARREGGEFAVVVRPATGVGAEEILFRSGRRTLPTDWSKDGEFLVCDMWSEASQWDIAVIRMNKEKKPVPFLQTPFMEFSARFSPDGRLLAYTSNETGQEEVFLRPFPGPGTALKISTAGGNFPVWSRDGRELYYTSPDNRTMSATILRKGPAVEIETVKALFQRSPFMRELEPFPDGARFLVNRVIEPKETDPITIVVNWDAMLMKR
ncbi:MAG: protein kinase [Bacteroidota bacterium]